MYLIFLINFDTITLFMFLYKLVGARVLVWSKWMATVRPFCYKTIWQVWSNTYKNGSKQSTTSKLRGVRTSYLHWKIIPGLHKLELLRQ